MTTRRLAIVFLLIIAAFLITSTRRPSSAATLCVNPGGTGGCFTTIQAAVNAASAGDTINVAAGTYNELVTVNKSLFLQGANVGIDACAGTRGAESVVAGSSGSTSFNVTANDVVINGFTIQGNTSSIQFGSGVLIGAGTSGAQLLNNIIQNNIAGILLGGDNSVIRGNRIQNNNNPGPNSGAGIYTDQFVAGGTLSGVTIDGNCFVGNSASALLFNSSDASQPATSIATSNNAFTGNGRAFAMFNLTSSSFTGNTVSGSTVAASADLRIFEGVSGLSISDNSLSGGAGQGLRISNIGTGAGNATNITMTCNSITNYAGNGVELDAGAYTGTLNAEDNWWGSATGPTIASNPGGTGESIVDPGAQVDYTPFRTSDIDTAPTLTCPANITQPNDLNQCGAVVTYANPTLTDNCLGSFTTTCVPASGSFFPVGTTTVNCSINTGGNKVSAAPNGGNCPTTITHSTSQVITPGNSISCNNEFGHSENSYWRAFNLPSFSITNPFAVQSVDIGIEDASTGGNGQKGKAARFSHSARSARTKSPNGAGQPLTVRLYTNTGGAFPDGTRNLLATANFTISDQSGTIVNLPISANVPAGSELVVEIFTPSGEVEGNYFFIGSNAAAETGTSYLSALECGASLPTPTAELGAPNMHIVMNVNGCEAPPGSACSFTVTVQDTQAPTINCPGDFTQSTDPNQCAAVVEYTPPGTSDNCPCAGTGTGVQLPDGESGCAVTCMPPSGATFPKGTTTITCTATDAAGNQSLPCTFSVTIADTQPPTITCPANQTVPTPDGNPVTVTYTAPTVTDNCSLSCQSSAAKPAGKDCTPGAVTCTPPSGSTFSAGTTTVTCTTCDCAGNSASCSFTVTVMPCAITCPANISSANDPNQCGAVVPFAPSASAGCGTVTCSPASGSFFPVGTTTVTCTTSAGPTCSFTVTIADTQPPQVTCPPNQTAVTGICGGSSQVITYPSPTASDNCPKVTTVCVPPSGSTFPVGVTSVTCTATDATGNTATCSFTVALFNACLQDDNNPNIMLVWNTATGAYRFCFNGTVFTGIGIVSNKGSVRTLNHISSDRRVSGKLDCATRRGEGGLQSPAGNLICSISDRDIGNNSCSCGMPVNSARK